MTHKSASYKPLGHIDCDWLGDSADEPCWGEVRWIDYGWWDKGEDLYGCDGHTDKWDTGRYLAEGEQ